MRPILLALAALAISGAGAFAQSTSTAAPPGNAMKLSQLVAKVEGRDKFLYVGDVEWSGSGYYTVTYFTSDKAKVEINIDPVSGNAK